MGAVAKEFIVYFNTGGGGGYNPREQRFGVGPAPRDDDGYLAPDQYETEDDARYAAYALIHDMTTGRHKEYNAYPYRTPRMFEREVGEWSSHDMG